MLITYFERITILLKLPDSKEAIRAYEAEQKQRDLERQIRKWKRIKQGSTYSDNEFKVNITIRSLEKKLMYKIIISFNYNNFKRRKNMIKDTLIIIGNGFTISLLNGSGINSSKPLSNFGCKSIEIDCISKMSGLESIIEEGREKFPNDDFKVFEFLINKYSNENNLEYDKLCFMRRYIAYAYSKLYIEGIQYINYSEWQWTEWFKKNKERICGIYNLNYDLFLEKLLKFLSIPHYRVATLSEKISKDIDVLKYMIPIYKPHGSIDFDAHKNFIQASEEVIWNTITNRNQFSVDNFYHIGEVHENELLKPRVEVDLIPPNSTNIYRDLLWIKNIYNQIKYDIKNIKNIICFGFSYSVFDQAEFNEILGYCSNKDIKLYDINIKENNELSEYIEKYGGKYVFKNTNLYNCDF